MRPGAWPTRPAPAPPWSTCARWRCRFTTALGMLVLPRQFALVRAHEAFNADGGLKEPKAEEAVAGVVQSLLQVEAALRKP
jgi:hypothetical protein